MRRLLLLLPVLLILSACQENLVPANGGPSDRGSPLSESLLHDTPLSTPNAPVASAAPPWAQLSTPPPGGCALKITMLPSSTPLGAIPSVFTPTDASVKVGGCVTFVNLSKDTHTATDKGGAFDTSLIPAGQSVTLTAARSGSYSYYCQVHPGMVGTLVVTGA